MRRALVLRVVVTKSDEIAAAVAAGRDEIEAMKRDFVSWATVSEGADFPGS